MKPKLFLGGLVQLNPDSAFYEVFPPDGKAPVKSVVPVGVSLIGSDEKLAYMLDVDRITDEQKNQIATICAAAAGTVEAEALQQMATIGMPIRKSQTSGVVS